MEKFLNINSILYVIPKDFENASIFNIVNFDENKIILNSKDFNGNYVSGEDVEIFVNTDNGIMYFKTLVEEYNNGILALKPPGDYKILQRRENQRIIINEDIILQEETTSFKAKLIDLSVGGIKIETENQLIINKEYKVDFTFDSLNLSFYFIPLRVLFENNKYQESGKIVFNKSIDKIELVQYCYKKIFEQSNR